MDVHPFIAGEVFKLQTPQQTSFTSYPGSGHLRVNSYIDVTAATLLENSKSSGESQASTVNRKTAFYRDGRRTDVADAMNPDAFGDWDKWVADRIAQRNAAIAEVMKDSGLTTPIPGLAEMKGQGSFFECAPYGTCWEPPSLNTSQQADGKVAKAEPASGDGQRGYLMEASFTPGRVSGAAGMQTSPTNTLLEEEAYFPCIPMGLRYRVVKDPTTGRERVISTGLGPDPRWGWAVCHEGSWIHRRHGYAWVVGHRRHHLEPVRWVKSGHKVAFVPIHPYDVKGRPPINRKEEVFAVDKENGLSLERIKADPEHPFEPLKSAPREFRTAYFPPLAHAVEPHLQAHEIEDVAGTEGTRARGAGIAIKFDPKSQTFTMSKQVMLGNRSVTVASPISNHTGNLQARGGSVSGGGGFHGSSGGSSGGSHGGGGGGGSSGGGAHGGGGGGSVSSASSASSSASSSGGHH
jgi:hypothetical protein